MEKEEVRREFMERAQEIKVAEKQKRAEEQDMKFARGDAGQSEEVPEPYQADSVSSTCLLEGCTFLRLEDL
eukprot:11210635-Lingulodinium_polyedra.AAC.1